MTEQAEYLTGHTLAGDSKTGPMVDCVICAPHSHKGIRHGSPGYPLPAIVRVSTKAYHSMLQFGALHTPGDDKKHMTVADAVKANVTDYRPQSGKVPPPAEAKAE